MRAYDRIQKLTADELTDAIMNKIWADFPMGSEKGLLIEAAVDKLRTSADVVEKAVALAHNAHEEANGNMLADERELYEAVCEMERVK